MRRRVPPRVNTRMPLLVVLSALALGATACSASPAASVPAASSTPGAGSPSATGWSLDPAAGAANIKAAGLSVLSAEGTAEHYHAHLDIIDDGQAVTVPAEIGFSFAANGQPDGISALHTHDTTGIIHIEAPTTGVKYTLGQVLTEWGVLNGSGAGGAGSSAADWTVYVNGAKQSGNAKDVVLAAHDEVLLAHGTAPAGIPASYAFPSGL